MRTLLVIDDNLSVRETLRAMLNLHGYAVLVAEDGTSGLTIFEGHAVDGAIVDVHMPGLDGFAVCRALRSRANEVSRNLPVWLMSGASTREAVKLAAEAGALALWAKPFELAEICRQLEQQFATGGDQDPGPLRGCQ